jgi:hypothetical protein
VDQKSRFTSASVGIPYALALRLLRALPDYRHHRRRDTETRQPLVVTTIRLPRPSVRSRCPSAVSIEHSIPDGRKVWVQYPRSCANVTFTRSAHGKIHNGKDIFAASR